MIKSLPEFKATSAQAKENPDTFWSKIASEFQWKAPWKQTLNFDFSKPEVKWFVGGKFGITWKVVQGMVQPRATLRGKCHINLSSKSKELMRATAAAADAEEEDEENVGVVVGDSDEEEDTQQEEQEEEDTQQEEQEEQEQEEIVEPPKPPPKKKRVVRKKNTAAAES